MYSYTYIQNPNKYSNMETSTLLKTILLLLLALQLTYSTVLPGRLLNIEAQCCNRCPQNIYEPNSYTPTITKDNLITFIERNIPDSMIGRRLRGIPTVYLESLLEVMEELRWREDQGFSQCSGNMESQDLPSYSQFDNTTINVIFESVLLVLKDGLQGRQQQFQATWIAFLQQVRKTYHQILEDAEYKPYTTDNSGGFEATSAVARKYAMAHLGMAVNSLSALKQRTVKNCFKSTDNQVYRWKSPREAIAEFPVFWHYYKIKQYFQEVLTPFNKTKADKYLNIPMNDTSIDCPFDIDIKGMTGFESLYDSSRIRNLAEESIEDIGSQGLQSFIVELERNKVFEEKLSSQIYTSLFRNQKFDGIVYGVDGSVLESPQGYRMSEKANKIWAKITAHTVGNLLHCYKPATLAALKESCPMTCRQCP